MHVGPIDLGEGAEIADPTKPPPVTVFGFDEVVQVLRDNETYSSTVYEDVMGMVMGRTILQMDEPEHRAIRTLVASSFRSKMLERWEEDLVGRRRQRADRHLHRRGPHRPRAVGDLQLPRAGDRPHPRAAALGLPDVPALGARAHERGRQLGAGRGRLGRAARLLRRRHGGAPGHARATTSSATWCGPRSTAST